MPLSFLWKGRREDFFDGIPTGRRFGAIRCPEVERGQKLSSRLILCFHVREPAGAGWIFLFIKIGSVRWPGGQPTTKHLRAGQLVRPPSGIHAWSVEWPLMGISAGEDLFLVVLTWRWDNRAGRPCYTFSGHSQRGLYSEECQGALGKEKQKRVPPRGLIPDSETNQTDLQLGSENDSNSEVEGRARGGGGCSFPSQAELLLGFAKCPSLSL